jgi:hypothetical protein
MLQCSKFAARCDFTELLSFEDRECQIRKGRFQWFQIRMCQTLKCPKPTTLV